MPGRSTPSNFKKSAENDKLHLKVQVWIYSPDPETGRVSVLVLRMRKDRGGYWQPVTGSVERGETVREGALREACEETGLRFQGPVRSLGERFRFQSRWGQLCEEHGFFLRAARDENGDLPEVRLDPREHTDYEWMSPSAASRRIEFASNRRMLRKLQDKLRQKRKVK